MTLKQSKTQQNKTNASAVTSQEQLDRLEAEARASLRHANNISKLLHVAKQKDHPLHLSGAQAVGRVFCDLAFDGKLMPRVHKSRKNTSTAVSSAQKVNEWLHKQLENFKELMFSWLIDYTKDEDDVSENNIIALRCLMELVGNTPNTVGQSTQSKHVKPSHVQFGRELLLRILSTLIDTRTTDQHSESVNSVEETSDEDLEPMSYTLLGVLQEEYINEFDDVRLGISRAVVQLATVKAAMQEYRQKQSSSLATDEFVKIGGKYSLPKDVSLRLAGLDAKHISRCLVELMLLVSLPPDEETWGARSFLVRPPTQADSSEQNDSDQESDGSDNVETSMDDDNAYVAAHSGQVSSRTDGNLVHREDPTGKNGGFSFSSNNTARSKRRSALRHASGGVVSLKASDLGEQKRAFQEAWMNVLSLPIAHDVYRRVLQQAEEAIIPHMSNPLALGDFLTSSYDVGGATALLALTALWKLIQNHGLEYPSFYDKLYALVTSANLRAKYRIRFFRMLDMFLASAALPAYIAAAFSKRLMRIALVSPPDTAICALEMTYNLLKRHSGCRHMVHKRRLNPREKMLAEKNARKGTIMDSSNPHSAAFNVVQSSKPEESQHTSNDQTIIPLPATDKQAQSVNESKQYDPLTDCLANANALYSELWEIAALRKHTCPIVAGLAAVFEKGFSRSAYDISRHKTTFGYGTIFTQLLEPKPQAGQLEALETKQAKERGQKNRPDTTKWSRRRRRRAFSDDQRALLLGATPLGLFSAQDIDTMSHGYFTANVGVEADWKRDFSQSLGAMKEDDNVSIASDNSTNSSNESDDSSSDNDSTSGSESEAEEIESDSVSVISDTEIDFATLDDVRNVTERSFYRLNLFPSLFHLHETIQVPNTIQSELKAVKEAFKDQQPVLDDPEPVLSKEEQKKQDLALERAANAKKGYADNGDSKRMSMQRYGRRGGFHGARGNNSSFGSNSKRSFDQRDRQRGFSSDSRGPPKRFRRQ